MEILQLEFNTEKEKELRSITAKLNTLKPG